MFLITRFHSKNTSFSGQPTLSDVGYFDFSIDKSQFDNYLNIQIRGNAYRYCMFLLKWANTNYLKGS